MFFAGGPRGDSLVNRIPIYSPSSANRATIYPSLTLRDKNAATRPLYWPPRLLREQPTESFTADRFIPQRFGRNFDAANHLLTKVPPRMEHPSGEVDIFEQIASLDKTWRKRTMQNALESARIFGQLNDRRVLNFTDHRTNHDNNKAHENLPDGSWKCKARNKPLIGRSEFTMEKRLISSVRSRRLGTFDWGGQNLMAIGVDDSVSVFDATTTKSRKIIKHEFKLPDSRAAIIAIKWNHAGTRIAVITDSSEVQVYSMEKSVWSLSTCNCSRFPRSERCTVFCLTWTRDDRQILTGCSEGCVSVYEASSGKLIDARLADISTITSIEFSLNDRYLAISSSRYLNFHSWPDLNGVFYFDFLFIDKPFKWAWHPWEVNILAISGYPGDDCISIWNVSERKCLALRKIISHGFNNAMTWNKLSGELVAQWYCSGEHRSKSVVVVFESLDRVVDCIWTNFGSSDLTWGPHNTQFAMRIKGQIKIWNFFGNETKKWYDPEKENDKKKKNVLASKRAMHNDQTIHFSFHNIR